MRAAKGDRGKISTDQGARGHQCSHVAGEETGSDEVTCLSSQRYGVGERGGPSLLSTDTHLAPQQGPLDKGALVSCGFWLCLHIYCDPQGHTPSSWGASLAVLLLRPQCPSSKAEHGSPCPEQPLQACAEALIPGMGTAQPTSDPGTAGRRRGRYLGERWG